ncbi:putative bifunctional diguanylate cyclase/phosphodiesterase [Stenotrophomonas tuberculopleuritidis]|uniref:putative bifunctional diguanylate cyclase/phosphodiesterase n=1 Tax=Stenotrophomonas tuberculopleuritidis TaxID=3055079 RepID=UPI0026E51E6D|nr:EAL domain-containing protein [Stenotrophomonas sp. 704A1]
MSSLPVASGHITVTVEDLMRAVDNDQLTLLYQPKLQCGSGLVVGAEALVRWQDPRMGLVPPDRFIPLAEQCGAIHRLGHWVLKAACRQLRQWRAAGNLGWSVAVNVSPLQLQRADFAQRVLDCLTQQCMPAHRLILEITESHMIESAGTAQSQLLMLRSAGVRISLDDFGVGFSNLARLKQLRVHELKIDRSFVSDVDRNQIDASIIEAIVAMASTLGLRVVAEGVERESQLCVLERLGCNETQGYLHAPPTSGDRFLARFGSHATCAETVADSRQAVAFG